MVQLLPPFHLSPLLVFFLLCLFFFFSSSVLGSTSSSARTAERTDIPVKRPMAPPIPTKQSIVLISLGEGFDERQRMAFDFLEKPYLNSVHFSTEGEEK